MAGNWGIFSPHDYAGVDQGVDFTGGGAIPALDAATVTDVGRASIIEGGTYPYVVYQLNNGPYKGHFVYVAENFAPTVRKGQQLRQGQSVGRALGTYPYIEVGFNKSPTGWNAVAPLGGASAAGQAMKRYIYGLIGTAAPVTIPAGGTATGGGGGGIVSHIPVVGGVVSGAEATASFFGKLLDPHFWLRAVEVVGGFLILMLGLYLLAHQAGIAGVPEPPTPGLSDEALADLKEPPGIEGHQPAYRRPTEGVRRGRVRRHEVSEAADRRKARRALIERSGQDAGDVPF